MKYRVKLEFELDSDLNVAQVRNRLKWNSSIVSGLRALAQVPDGGLCTVTSYSASHATPYGRKPTDDKARRFIAAHNAEVDAAEAGLDDDIAAIASAHAPDDIVRPSERFVD
jgi:hypothetical protein